ncbi:MAG: hypothetical protein U0Z53_19385 [Blastocatellia bacterium]
MRRKFLCLMLVFVLCGATVRVPAAVCSSAQQPSPEQIEKIKAAVAKIGEGPQARVVIKLRDGSGLKGYIKESGEQDFVIRQAGTVKDTRVDYAQVAEVKAPREFHVSPFVVRMALIAVPLIVIAAIASNQNSRRNGPLVISAK